MTVERLLTATWLRRRSWQPCVCAGKEPEKARERYDKATMKLHNLHNQYVLAVRRAQLQQEQHRDSTLPLLLDSLQKMQEDMISALWVGRPPRRLPPPSPNAWDWPVGSQPAANVFTLYKCILVWLISWMGLSQTVGRLSRGSTHVPNETCRSVVSGTGRVSVTPDYECNPWFTGFWFPAKDYSFLLFVIQHYSRSPFLCATLKSSLSLEDIWSLADLCCAKKSSNIFLVKSLNCTCWVSHR